MIYEFCVFICHQEGDNDICMLCVHTVYDTRKEIMIYVCCVLYSICHLEGDNDICMLCFMPYMPTGRR